MAALYDADTHTYTNLMPWCVGTSNALDFGGDRRDPRTLSPNPLNWYANADLSEIEEAGTEQIRQIPTRVLRGRATGRLSEIEFRAWVAPSLGNVPLRVEGTYAGRTGRMELFDGSLVVPDGRFDLPADLLDCRTGWKAAWEKKVAGDGGVKNTR